MAKRYRLPLFATRVGLPTGSKETASDGWFYPKDAAEETALIEAGCEADDLGDPERNDGSLRPAEVEQLRSVAAGAQILEAQSTPAPVASAVGVRYWRQLNDAPAWIHRVSADSYRLGWLLDSGEWAVVGVAPYVVGAYTTHEIQAVGRGFHSQLSSFGETSPSITWSGDTWASVAAAGVFGGTWRRSNVLGAAYVVTTPPCRHIILESFRTTNMGYGRVTVDGGSTVPNALPTAAQEVASGAMPASALVSNGGPLQPTDRVLRFYSPLGEPASRVVVATNLPLGVHTVRVECVLVKPAAATDFRIGLSAIHTGTGLYDAPSEQFVEVESLSCWPASASAFEYAYVATINGVAEFVGNVHGYESSTLTVVRDGAVVAMSDGQVLVGRDLALVKSGTLYHPQSTSTPIGTAETRYRPGASGLRCTVELNFTGVGTINTGYVGMLPVQNWQQTATFVGKTGSVSVAAITDAGVNHFAGDSYAALMQRIGVVHDAPELSFVGGRYLGSSQRSWYEDRAGGSLNKAYFSTHQAAQAMPLRVSADWRYLIWS